MWFDEAVIYQIYPLGLERSQLPAVDMEQYK